MAATLLVVTAAMMRVVEAGVDRRRRAQRLGDLEPTPQQIQHPRSAAFGQDGVERAAELVPNFERVETEPDAASFDKRSAPPLCCLLCLEPRASPPAGWFITF